MKKSHLITRSILFILSWMCIHLVIGQVVTSDPPFPTDDQAVMITFDASQGSGGLAGYSGDVYAHTGVITDKSTGPGDWKYVKTNWGENTPETKLTRINGDIYQLELTPDIRQYYNVPSDESVRQMAFVFRSGETVNGQYLEGKTATFGDIFVDVFEEEPPFVGQVLSPAKRTIVDSPGSPIPLKAIFSNSADVIVYKDNSPIMTIAATTSLEETIEVENDFSGHYIEMVATSGADSFYFDFTYAANKMHEDIDLDIDQPFGANIIEEDGQEYILFKISAPGKRSALVQNNLYSDQMILDENAYMFRSEDSSYFWNKIEITGDLPDPLLYQYIIDGELHVADPHSEVILDRFDDVYIDDHTFVDLPEFPRLVEGQHVSVLYSDEFSWTDTQFIRPDKRDLIIYEILLRDFIEEHSFQGLLDKIPYLKELGINAIELMPVNEFEGNLSWGYNPSFHGAIDKYYGHPDNLRKLVNICHEEGIAVIADVVFNHAFSQSPLAELYWDAAAFQPAADNPWLNQVARHPFNVGYDINHESSETKVWMYQILRDWIDEYHFDGYRFDLSKGFTQTNSGSNVGLWGQYDASRVAILKQLADSVWAADSDAYIILEHFADNSEERELADYGMMLWGNMNGAYSEAAMGYHDGGKSNLSGALYFVRNWSEPHLVAYMESHDEERMMYRNLNYGNSSGSYDVTQEETALDRVAAAATMFYSLPGPKMLWQFGELGYPHSINECPDGSVHSDCRLSNKPIRWDLLDNDPNRELMTKVSDLMHLKIELSDFIHNATLNYDLSAEFKSLKYSSTDLNAIIVANFDVASRTPFVLFQHTGTWYDFFSGDSIQIDQVAQNISFQPGEYHIYLDKRLLPHSLDQGSAVQPVRHESMAYRLFPNPVNAGGWLHLSADDVAIDSVRIYHRDGRPIAYERISVSEHGLSLRLPSGIAPGAYYLIWRQSDKNVVSPFIIIH